ncbi:MAG: hypothetical protein KDE03_12955 [Rhodobacteraceae bacterium]|nr:hypothetical protein [Paracoccaceae bacterium]
MKEADMIQFANISAPAAERISIVRGTGNLGLVVQQQIRILSAEEFTDFDVRWNRSSLSIEARSDTMIVRRDFDATGTLECERIVDGTVGIKRIFDCDGFTPISEEMFDIYEDR